MDNYSKVLEFFMENNIQLTQEQIEALKEEFLDEITNDGGPKTSTEREIIKNNPRYSVDQRKSDIYDLMNTKYSKFKTKEKRNEDIGEQDDHLKDLMKISK